MPRVVIVQEHLPHYRQRFYELLHAALAGQGVTLDLVYSPHVAANLLAGRLPWATPVPIQRWKSLAWQNVFPICRGADMVIVQQESKYLANFLLQLRSFVSTQKLAYWGHGRNFQSENASIAGETIKRIASRYCNWWFAYNDFSVDIVKSLGFPEDRITSVQNAIDTRAIAEARNNIPPGELAALKARLGIKSDNVGVFTGGLYREKRLPFLLEACQLIRRDIPDFELIVIGKGPEADFIEAAARQNEWIHFVGPKSDREKVPYWALSKLLLMPGLVGLVVLDSFALGVPMITTDYPYHSPEISYLKDGENGLIVKPWPDPEEYARRTVELLRDPDRISRLARKALEDADRYSVERMSKNFAEGVLKALAAPKLRRSSLSGRPAEKLAKRDTTNVGVVVRSMAPYLRDFYDNLSAPENGVGVKIFIGQRGTDWVNPWDSTLMNLRRADHVYVNGRTSSKILRTIFPTRELFNALERYAPTILLINEYSPLSIFGAIWAGVRGVPWVIATDIGPDYRPPYPRLKFSQKIVHAIANRLCFGVLALTPSAAKKARMLGKPYLLSPHAINTSIYLPGTKPCQGDRVRLIAVGNFIYRKGYDLLFRAMATLPRKCAWELNCYGAGSQLVMRELASDLGIVDRVNFFAFVEVSGLIEAYQAADVFVLASRSDTYGVVVHEAAACGLPLVVSKYCGASEVLVEEGKNGYVIDPEDTEAFARRLEEVISSPDKRAQFGRHSRELAEKWDVRRNAANAAEWLKERISSQLKR
ncbi:MAG: glycosyltransferase family 4 protein [Verrucomicrobia bacterium]|nr:glycosyltransferase family 4 protein [Verrucomicrobiota bacterium]